jgi:hypothetical protein
MGKPLGRVEKDYILGMLSENRMPVRLHSRDRIIEGTMVEGEDGVVTVECDEREGREFSPGDPVRVYFSYYGHTMTFETEVKKAGSPLILKHPNGLVKNLERKFERVDTPEGLTLSFLYEDVVVELGFPKTETWQEVDEPIISEYFDENRLEELIAQFRSQAVNFAEYNNIIMFRDRPPQSYEEELITAYGKCLYLPRMSRGLARTGTAEGRPVITADLIPESAEEHPPGGKTRRQAHDYFQQKAREKGIIGEIYAPIMYLNYVIGYVYMSTQSEEYPPFSMRTLDFAVEFSYVLVHTLKNYGYFNGEERREVKEYSPQIIDISAAGVLFSYPTGELTKSIGVYTDLELFFEVKGRRIKVDSRVMRKYQSNGNTFFGVQFLEIAPEDFRFLFDYVYGRPFTEKDDELWEGGASPPELEL